MLEENTIVSEVQFSESVTGASVIQGTFYSERGRAPPAGGAFGTGRRFLASDSREWTVAHARSRIQNIAYAVQLAEHHVEAAHRWYVLALQHNFTRGRKSQHIAAACLYIVCRQEKTSHMLLDFSDVLQANVFELGNMYLRLCRLLSVELPLIDPSLYIGRFASRLELGDKTQAVANTALRLVSRMKRDWIQTGRRPAGICGACLLLAARLYGFSRSQRDIIEVVRVCELTLRKRLDEFARTPSARLTPDEFHGVWLEQEEDPPAFVAAKAKDAAVLLQAEKHALAMAHSLSLTHSLTHAHALAHTHLQEPASHYVAGGLFDVHLALTPVSSGSVVEDVGGLGDLEGGGAASLEAMDADLEVAHAVLSDEEIMVRTKLWMKANADFILAQQERERLAQELADKGILKAPPKKRPRKSTSSTASSAAGKATPAATPSEAAKSMIAATKKLSKKFNYEALDSLLQDTAVASLADMINHQVDKSSHR